MTLDVLADDAEVAALDTEEANIRKAEQLYRSDPALAADFERSGWFPERTAGVRRGEVVWSEGRIPGEPTIKIAPALGQIQIRPSFWAGFTDLIGEIAQRRAQLIERRRPEILRLLADREADLRQRVLDCRVRDLDQLVEEATGLLATVAMVRGPVPRTVRTPYGLAPERFRERTDAVELVDAARNNWSLLQPLDQDEPLSVISHQLGIQRDTSPSPTVGEVRDRYRQLRYGTHRG